MTAQQKRSEVVRARRSQRQSSPRGSRAKHSTTTRQMPPVVSRSVIGTPRSAAKYGRRKEAARVYDISLASTGAEARLPAVSLPHPTWRILSLLLVFMFGYLFYYVWTLPQFNVSDTSVVVNGLDRVNEQDLLALSDILDKPVFMINTTDLENFLLEQAPLESAKVTVEPSGLVTIDVVERVPVIVWQQKDGVVWWVDKNGVRFRALGGSEGLIHVEADDAPPAPPAPPQENDGETQDATLDAAAVPTTEDDNGQLMEPQLVAGIMAIPAYLPEGATLIYDKEYGIGWKDPAHNWVVYFGKELNQMPLRLHVYQSIVDYLSDKNNQPVMISVEFIYAPYYRMEP